MRDRVEQEIRSPGARENTSLRDPEIKNLAVKHHAARRPQQNPVTENFKSNAETPGRRETRFSSMGSVSSLCSRGIDFVGRDAANAGRRKSSDIKAHTRPRSLVSPLFLFPARRRRDVDERPMESLTDANGIVGPPNLLRSCEKYSREPRSQIFDAASTQASV
jgi:hypothetical protein